MYDLEDDPDTASNYECLACGEVISSEDRPTECTNCGESGTFRNRALSLE